MSGFYERLTVFIVLFFFGVSAYAYEFNLAPGLYYRSDSSGKEFKVLGPILEVTSDHFALRPFFYRDYKHTDFLYPLGKSSNKVTRLSPLFSYYSSGRAYSFNLFPFFCGNDGKRSYHGIFPLYGKLYGRFGFKEARFFLWPLYSRTVRERGVVTYSILWPIFTYSRDREFKIFPLYGLEKGPDTSYHYILWPLFHAKKTPDSNMHAFLPLFMLDRGPHNMSLSLLWPFFTYNRDDKYHHRSIECPWPILRFASGGYREVRIFPLYWTKQQGFKKKFTVLWPIYQYHTNGINTTQRRYLILSSNTVEINKKGKVVHTIHAWPILYRKNTTETLTWHFPDIIPFEGKHYRENIEPILTLVKSSKDKDSYTLDMLWHTLYLKRKNTFKRLSVSFLFSYERDKSYRKLGFLFDTLHVNLGTPCPTTGKK